MLPGRIFFDSNMFQWLLDNKAPINQQDENGFTPLLYAVARNEVVMISALIKAGANVNEISYAGNRGYKDA
jgi:ankyrin repeat protein